MRGEVRRARLSHDMAQRGRMGRRRHRPALAAARVSHRNAPQRRRRGDRDPRHVGARRAADRRGGGLWRRARDARRCGRRARSMRPGSGCTRRPTAINLRWALDAAREALASARASEAGRWAYRHAAEVADEDVAINRALGAERRSRSSAIWRRRKSPAGRSTSSPTAMRAGSRRSTTARPRPRSIRDGGRPQRPRLCRRDAPAQSGRFADRLGASEQ